LLFLWSSCLIPNEFCFSLLVRCFINNSAALILLTRATSALMWRNPSHRSYWRWVTCICSFGCLLRLPLKPVGCEDVWYVWREAVLPVLWQDCFLPRWFFVSASHSRIVVSFFNTVFLKQMFVLCVLLGLVAAESWTVHRKNGVFSVSRGSDGLATAGIYFIFWFDFILGRIVLLWFSWKLLNY
jgi:hypothetical protein